MMFEKLLLVRPQPPTTLVKGTVLSKLLTVNKTIVSKPTWIRTHQYFLKGEHHLARTGPP